MHGRIIQIETDPRDLLDGSLADALGYDDWFFHNVADSVSRDDDPGLTIDDFESQIELTDRSHACNGPRSFVLADEPERCLKRYFAAFTDAVRRLQNVGFEEFSKHGWLEPLEAAREAFSERYGTWVWSCAGGYQTVQDFLRCAKPNTRYYYGATADYHF